LSNIRFSDALSFSGSAYSDTTFTLKPEKSFFELQLTAANGVCFGLTKEKDVVRYNLGTEGICWYTNGVVNVYRSVRFKNGSDIKILEDPKTVYPNGSYYGVNISQTSVDLYYNGEFQYTFDFSDYPLIDPLYFFSDDIYGYGITNVYNFGESKFAYPIPKTISVNQQLNAGYRVELDLQNKMHGYR